MTRRTSGPRPVADSGSPREVRRLTTALLGVCVLLAALSLGLPNVTDWSMLAAPDAPVRRLVDVAGEQSLPTWFSVVVLGLAAAVHLVAATFARGARSAVWRLWVVSALVIAAMSVDDATSLHEQLDGLGRSAGADTFPFAWVIPGAVLGLAVATALVLLARRLEGEPRWALVAGLALVIGAALGLETVNGVVLEGHGPSRMFVVGTHVEELAEMIGGVLLLRGGLAALSFHGAGAGDVVVAYRGGARPRRQMPVGEPLPRSTADAVAPASPREVAEDPYVTRPLGAVRIPVDAHR